MKRFHIFVEDNPDREFLIQYSKFLKKSGQLEKDLSKSDITPLKGYSINMDNATDIREKTESDTDVVLIVDADKFFDERIAYYESKKVEHNLVFEVFLIPNDKDSGNAESIYESITKRDDFWECFDKYLTCLDGKGFQTTLPKSKIYAYNEAMREKANNKDVNKELNFLDTNIWDLENDYLEPLKVLLQKLINIPYP